MCYTANKVVKMGKTCKNEKVVFLWSKNILLIATRTKH